MCGAERGEKTPTAKALESHVRTGLYKKMSHRPVFMEEDLQEKKLTVEALTEQQTDTTAPLSFV